MDSDALYNIREDISVLRKEIDRIRLRLAILENKIDPPVDKFNDG